MTKEKKFRSFFIWGSLPENLFSSYSYLLLLLAASLFQDEFLQFLLLLYKNEPSSEERETYPSKNILKRRKNWLNEEEKLKIGVFHSKNGTHSSQDEKDEKKNELRLFILFYAGVLLLCVPPFERDPKSKGEGKKSTSLIKPFLSFSFGLRLVKMFFLPEPHSKGEEKKFHGTERCWRKALGDVGEERGGMAWGWVFK
jgi:hypothetical protein